MKIIHFIKSFAKGSAFCFLWIGLSILGLILGVIVLLIILFSFNPFSSSQFNQQKWMTAGALSNDMSCYRGAMGKDIIRNVLKEGMAVVEIETLLGAPEIKKKNELQYGLGMCSGVRMDYDFIHIYLNDDGRMISAEILQH